MLSSPLPVLSRQAFLEPDDVKRETSTGSTAWGELALKATREVLSDPSMQVGGRHDPWQQ